MSSNTQQTGNPEDIAKLRAAEVMVNLGAYLDDRLSADEARDRPKHQVLARALLDALETGVVHQGDRLPSEQVLTAMTPFSLGTVQKAMKSLMLGGYIDRKTGVGTVVTANRDSVEAPLHCRYLGPDGTVAPVFPKVLARNTVTETGPWSDALGEDARIVVIDRLMRVGDAFTLYSRFYVDAGEHPVFEELPFPELETANFKTLMAARTDHAVARLAQRLRMRPATAETAMRLGVKPGSTILTIQATARSGRGNTLYFQEFFVPPNDFDLSIDTFVDDVGGL